MGVGFSENCAERIREVSYSADGSRFSLGEATFESPLIGEFNVRNAAMAAVAARFYGLTPEVIQTALTSFEGIARRQEVRAKVRGVTVIDDFGHHPTAIRETLGALRHRYPGAPALGDFRAALEHDATRGFPAAIAGGAAVGRRRFHRADRGARADPGRRTAESRSGRRGDRRGGPAGVLRARRGGDSSTGLVPLLQPNDVVTIFSNGGFDGIHEKLLGRLRNYQR